MLDFNEIRDVVVLGGGAAGWFAAAEARRLFGPQTAVTLVESPDIGIVGVGEGGIVNLVEALKRNGIDPLAFMRETEGAFKLGFAYRGWHGGGEEDVYYHLFNGPLELANGFDPQMSALLANGLGIGHAVRSMPLVVRGASQDDVLQALKEENPGFTASLHFDSHRLAEYLRRIASGRGVQLRLAKVQELLLAPETGWVRALKLDDGDEVPVGFLIDASGFARFSLGRTYKAAWRSFAPWLLLDRAIPFHMPHPGPNPALVTNALAMPNGWMWQIPLQKRVGAGYVYSSAHVDDDTALGEIERRLGFAVQPMRTLRFEPGHFEQVWRGNVMAVGLASGFVEPLEATSIGQMLEQLAAFGLLVAGSHGVVSDLAIERFNQANADYWRGILDFLRMHYDVRRRDTPFWRDAAERPLSPGYAALKQVWQRRTPRPFDTVPYRLRAQISMFGPPSWLAVGQGVGAIPPQAAQAELQGLPAERRRELDAFVASVRVSTL